MSTDGLMRQPPHRRYQPEYLEPARVETAEESRIWVLEQKLAHCGDGKRGQRRRRKYERFLQAMKDK